MASSHIISAMQAKYPQADFAAYFAFIDACAATPQSGPVHRHHIAPREQFPELAKAATNLISVAVENHKQAHCILAQSCMVFKRRPTPQFIASAKLGGLANKEKGTGYFALGMAAKGGRIAGRLNKEKAIGIFAANQHALGGSISGRNHVIKGTGCHAPGMPAKGGLFGNHARWHVNRGTVKAGCSLCVVGSL